MCERLGRRGTVSPDGGRACGMRRPRPLRTANCLGLPACRGEVLVRGDGLFSGYYKDEVRVGGFFNVGGRVGGWDGMRFGLV